MGKWLIVWVVVLAGGVCASGRPWSIEGAFDYESSQLSALYWLDPNGGIGVLTLSDSAIPEGTWDNVAVGPVVEFRLDPLYRAVLGTLLPFVDWPADLPVELFGEAGLLCEVGRDHDLTGFLGTKIRLLPGRRVQPTITGAWVVPEGGGDREVRALFGATVWLGR